ncbi:MAG: sugar-binding protein [Actinomycetota bacterium]|nr:sugar-binding protein [Actinomycetota bacterium]
MAGVRKTGVRGAVAACAAAAIVAAVAPGTAARAAVPARRGPRPVVPAVRPASGVGLLAFRPVRRLRALPAYRPVHDAWPAPGAAMIRLAVPEPPLAVPVPPVVAALTGGNAGGMSRGRGTPLLAGSAGLGRGPSAVRMRVLSQRAAAAAGVRGVLFTVRAAAGSPGGAARVGISYAGFSQAAGGNFGAGLGLAELPGCALTTPRRPACDRQVPLRSSANDWEARTVTAGVTLRRGAADSAGAVMVLAATTTYSNGGGLAGTYAATSLKPSGTWTAGGSSGSFTYSYPLAVPPAAGGLEPALSLSYDSGTVDGQTADTQPQASWVGDGWTLAGGHSFMEQSFIPCSDKPEGSASLVSTDSLCYNGPVLTLSLGGTSVPVVCPLSTFSYTKDSTCAASADNGEIITHHVASGKGQGTKFTDYWTVTTRNGTTYYFGLNRLPGWASGDPATNSVSSVPVFSAHAPKAGQFTDPCYSSAGFKASVCTMAYRWNLDFVTEPHGNAMSYYYTQDSNAYAQYGSASAVSYTRSSYLARIDYGLASANAYPAHAPDQVVFTPRDRCFATTCNPIGTYYKNWPDVPYHQDYCAAGSTSCPVSWPTFWSTVGLASVKTQQWNGSAYLTADSWALGQSLPAQTDNTANLWLDSITRTGSDTTAGGSAFTLPKVSFTPVQLANRVDPGTYPYLYRNRIGQITTESGAVISITYETPDPCSATSLPSPASNTQSCFPEYWGAFTSTTGPDWFNKYAVKSVQVKDPAGGSPGLYTSYAYSTPAWHYDDNELVLPGDRTYGQWRGYQNVQTFTGSGSAPQTDSATTYYQGMSDDNNTTAVYVKDSQQNLHPDLNQLAGDVLESTTYAYAGGPADHSRIYSYWVSPAQMSRTRPGLPDLTANFTGQVEDWARQAITDTGTTTWRITETDTTYDSTAGSAFYGLPLFIFRHGDLSQPAQQACTTISYAAANTSLNLAGLPAEVETDAVPCGGANPGGSSVPTASEINALTAPAAVSRPAQVISDTRTFYDDPSLAATWPQPSSPAWPQPAPGNPDVSVVQQATGWTGTAFTYQTAAADVYDSYGRVVKSYNAGGGYTPATGTYAATATSYTMTAGSTTREVVTNPLGQATTTTLDPLRGLPVTVTDPNGITTTMHYDGLGRLTAVWKYGRATTATPNLSYTYNVSDSGPTVVTTRQLNDAGGQITSTTLYDSLLRVRQTQYPTPQGGVLVTDHFYDSHGWQWKTNINWWDPAANPGSAILTVPDSQVHDQVVTAYDGLGRPVSVTSYDDSSVRSVSYTAYYGDKVTTVPPAGGTPTSTVSDALGRTTQLDQYTTAPSVTTGTNSGGFPAVTITGGTTQATTYSYDTRGLLSAITAAGESWTRSYNLLGQVTSTTSPNSGTSAMTYDPAGNVASVTNGDSKTVTYTYDPLGRKTGEYAGTSSSAPKIATWSYDNSDNAVPGMANPVGHLTTETSYDSAGNAYVIQQDGFNAFGESTGETVTIPSTTATTAAGGSLAGTYSLGHFYTATTGLPLRDYYPASPAGAGQTAGTLPAETVIHGYCTGFDLPCSLASNLAGYTQNVTYTALFQVGQQQIGTSSASAYITSTYDQNTGSLTQTQVANTAVSATPYDTTSYAYDPAGNVTSITDVRNGTQTEVQCYTYDLLDRLASAWTTNGGPACNAGPSTGSGGTVGDGIPGGAYWTSWTYSPLGDQTQQVQHSITGGTSTVTAYNYNNGNGTTSGQPDTLTSTATTGPGAGTSTYTYDPAGNTLTRNLPSGNQSLAWNPDGTLKTVTTAAGTTSFVYDASGNLLLQQAPGATTLYVFGEQLILSTATGAITGTRILPLPGGGLAVRTGTGTSYTFELTGPHGTGLLTLDNLAQNPAWRQYTPFGAPRGTTPATWPDTNAFLGDPTATGTGLDLIGARAYDPATGRFISADPLQETASPQQLNGYAYAADNPVTTSDPTGLSQAGGNHNPCGSNPSCNPGSPATGNGGQIIVTDASSTWSGGFGGHPVVFIASKQWQEVLTGSAGIFTLSAQASLATTSQAPVTFTFRNGLPDGAVVSLPDGVMVTIPIEAFKVTGFAAGQVSHLCGTDCAISGRRSMPAGCTARGPRRSPRPARSRSAWKHTLTC